MVDTREQVRPLAPAVLQSLSLSDEEEALSTHLKLRQRKYINCFGCFTAFLLILVLVFLVLFLTVFHVRGPVISMSSITLDMKPQAVDNVTKFRTDTNLTFVIDVSVKNPNMASFKFNNSTTTVLYEGRVVGEGMIPSGKAKARRTIHMNVTVVMIPEKILEVPRWVSDESSGTLNVSSNTRIDGEVKILIKKKFAVEVNCSITYHISSQKIQENCWPRFI